MCNESEAILANQFQTMQEKTPVFLKFGRKVEVPTGHYLCNGCGGHKKGTGGFICPVCEGKGYLPD